MQAEHNNHLSAHPLVSIALCTYNGAKYLEPQLNSLVNQSYPNLEIVVMDDVSSDDTYAILSRYAEKYPFFKCMQNGHNLGYVRNFEKAISACKGTYIALADQDDLWDLDKIALMVAEIGDAAMIYHDSEMVDEQGKPLGQKISSIYNMYQGKQPYPFFFWNCVSGHSLLFNSRLLPAILPFDDRFYHDWAISIIATTQGGIKYLDSPLVKYRQHETSTTDILNFRNDSIAKYNSVFNPYSLGFLAFVGPRLQQHSSYITALLSCFNQDAQIINRFKLFSLLLAKCTLLLYRSKKSLISKFNYIKRASQSKV